MSEATKILHLDSIGSLERIFKRDYNSEKFVIACYVDNNDNELASYISSELCDMELCYLIAELERRRRVIFDG